MKMSLLAGIKFVPKGQRDSSESKVMNPCSEGFEAAACLCGIVHKMYPVFDIETHGQQLGEQR